MSENTEFIESMEKHIESKLGEIHMVLHEKISAHLHIDLYWVISEYIDEKYNYFITSGMSSLPMKVDDENKQFAELVIILPENWKLDKESIQKEKHWWPLRLLKLLARYPHENGTWIGEGHTIPLSSDLIKSSGFSAVMLHECQSLSFEFEKLNYNNKTINFYCIYPLYIEELEYAYANGSDAMKELLLNNDYNDVLNVKRKNCIKK